LKIQNIDKRFAAIVPGNVRLVMCDVDCGSETVGMVKNVLSWRKAKPEEALLLWETLQKGNEDLATELENLALKPAKSSGDYDNIREVILTIRSLIREMSLKSGVPIEPVVQTELINSCCQLPGVVGGIVPGAGGFDAVALLVENKEHVIDGLRQFLENYRAEGSDGASVSIGKVRLLRVKQEDQGVRKENRMKYQEWLR
jgi:phosphomevalonate kinase